MTHPTTTPPPALGTLLRAVEPAILADWHARLLNLGGNHALGLTPRTELDREMRELLAGLLAALDAPAAPAEAGVSGVSGVSGGAGALPPARDLDGHHSLTQALRAASNLRAARGYTANESLRYLLACKCALVAALPTAVVDAAAVPAAILCIDELLDRCVEVLFSAFVSAREDVIRRQGESLREVSAPVITLWDSLLLLPLVGIVDSVRAQQIAETLLEAISRSEAEVTLIDVTGVPVMDTSVARHILKTVAAAEMLGTRVILTGIGPSTAQTMVKLGIDMSGVPTRASLKSGLALALTLTRRAIVPLDGRGTGHDSGSDGTRGHRHPPAEG